MGSSEGSLAYAIGVLRDASAPPQALQAALRVCAAVLETAQHNTDAWRLRGLIRRRLEDLPGGELDLRRALCLEPTVWRAQASLTCNGAPDRQAESLLRAWVTDPASEVVLPTLLVLLSAGTVSKDHLRNRTRVLGAPSRRHPSNPSAWALAGWGVAENLTESIAIDRRMLILNPIASSSIRALVQGLGKCGDVHAGLRWIGCLGCLEPNADLRWLPVSAAQPPVHDSMVERDSAMAALGRAIEELERPPPPTSEPGTLGGRRLFYCAYAGIDETELMKRFGAVTSRLATPVRWPRGPTAAPQTAVVTGLAHDHSVWNAIGRWWGRCLSEAGVPCRLYDLNADVSDTDRARFTDVISGLRPFPEWRNLIASAGHRLLLYPEIGIEPTALYLANHRLAPVQINSWGHPTTSGLPTIDQYLGAELFDPSGAERFYSERLIRLPGIGVETEQGGPARRPAPSEPSGPPTALLCQSVFKYLPDFDEVLVEIAVRVPNVRFVIVRTGAPEVFERYMRRLAGCFARAGLASADQVRVQDRMPKADFHRLLAQVDLYLDPPSFSGFNTALMAIEAGLPVLTQSGGRLRERLAAGVLMKLEAPETVVASRGAYLEAAASLLMDRGRARALGRIARDRLPRLADDPDARGMFLETVRRGLS